MESEAYKIVNKLFLLSQETSNQAVIVRRGVLPSLVTFLKNDQIQVQVKSCETLKNLSSHPDNQKIMSTESNLVDSLILVFNDKHTNSQVRQLISEILINLSDYLTDEQKESTLSLKVVLESLKNLGKKRMIILSFKKMDVEKEKIQKILLQMKGTISCSFDMNQKRLTLFTRSPSQYVLTILESFEVVLISEEVFDQENEKENQEPSYLDSKKYNQNQNKAIVCESFQERMEKRKKKEEEGSSVYGIFSKISSVFW